MIPMSTELYLTKLDAITASLSKWRTGFHHPKTGPASQHINTCPGARRVILHRGDGRSTTTTAPRSMTPAPPTTAAPATRPRRTTPTNGPTDKVGRHRLASTHGSGSRPATGSILMPRVSSARRPAYKYEPRPDQGIIRHRGTAPTT